jgi:hypothetical protein
MIKSVIEIFTVIIHLLINYKISKKRVLFEQQL